MNENRSVSEAEARAAEEEVFITLEKRSGSTSFMRSIQASSPRAVVNGIANLVKEAAALLGLTTANMLGALAVALLAPEKKESEKHAEGQ